MDNNLNQLVARLYDHADVHETYLPIDTFQRQWTDDLREAAAWLEQMSAALKIVHTWSTGWPGALDPSHIEAMCANALSLPPN